ncbi:MAG: response regulator [Pseudomonadota bacterium]|nr:response regulator [Pseudomonadota bacterium]
MAMPNSRVDASPRMERLSNCVLVADDNRDIAFLLSLCLCASGYVVLVVHDGYAAVTVSARHRPAAVILDVEMPVMDGYSAAQQIRCALGPSVLLIAHTALTDQAVKDRCRSVGFNRHIVKGCEFGVVENLIAARLTRHPLQNHGRQAIIPRRAELGIA